MIKVDTGIPVPKHHGNRKYPFGDLEVGQSFLATNATRNCLASSASVYAKKHGTKFTVRETREGVRVWRVA